MINILFALIALGAMCIDIVLNRGLVEEIIDEAKEHKEKINALFKEVRLKKAREYTKKSKDGIDSLTSELLFKVKESCASKRARFFYFTIGVLSICIVVSAIMELLSEALSENVTFLFWYNNLGICGYVVCFIVLAIYLKGFYNMLQFSFDVEKERKGIRNKVQDTIIRAGMIVGDPTGPLLKD